MISDEMRELLSSYVDGELPHGEAARVEEAAKRDPRMAVRIRAYRRLRETLRVWDVEEHGQWPSRGFKERALARVRAYEAERRYEKGGAPSVWWRRPAALAAGVLLAFGLGLLVAIPRSEPDGAAVMARSDGLSLAPVEPYGDFRADFDASELPPTFEGSGSWPPDVFRGIVRHETDGIAVQLDGETVIARRRTLPALKWLRELEKDFDDPRTRRRIQETRTGTQRNVMVASLLDDFEVETTGLEGLVAIRRPAEAGKAGAVPAMRAAPVWTDEGARTAEGGEMDATHYLAVADGSAPVLTMAGELWIEPLGDARDGRVGRSRVVTGTTWVKSGELVGMAWASGVEADPKANWKVFHAESFVLGPTARRELLGRNGRDADVLKWLQATYGNDGAIAAARAASKRHRAVVERMVTALGKDEQVTGFAVHGERGELLGTELFATHELMMQFAERLLRGYLLEAGGQIRLKAKNGENEAALARVRVFLHHDTARTVQQVVEVRTWKDAEDWPEGMRQVNLVSPTRQVIGHGLFLGNDLVQLSLFAR